jgi:hypothetical protein
MSSTNLIRWSGLAALVGGILLAVLSILESVLFGSQPDSEVVASSAWIIVEVAWIVAALLIILGLVGLYARQAEQAGSLGLIAFLVALAGTVMVSGIDWSAAFMAPWFAETAPELVDAEPTGVFLAGLLLSLVLLALGYFLFGLASLQARMLPRGAAVLLMVGAVLIVVMGFLESGFDVVVLGAALAWMGYALWSGTAAEPASIPEVAM